MTPDLGFSRNEPPVILQPLGGLPVVGKVNKPKFQ